METLTHAVSSVMVILLLTATGYLCAERGWMRAEDKRFLSKYLMTIGVPVMMVYSMQKNLSREDILAAPKMLLVPLAVIPVCVALSWCAGRAMKLPREQQGVFVMMAAMGNTIFIGLAMCVELFGEASTSYVMLFYPVSSCFTQMVGIPLVRWSGESGGFSREMVRRFLRTPSVLAVLASLALVLLDVKLPTLLMSYGKYINGTVSPMALVLTGYIIHEIGLKNLRITKSLGVMTVFRFVLSPLLGAVMCAALDIGGMARSVYVLELAMPVVTQTVVAASEYGADEQYAAQGTALTTLLCFVVTPVLMMLLR